MACFLVLHLGQEQLHRLRRSSLHLLEPQVGAAPRCSRGWPGVRRSCSDKGPRAARLITSTATGTTQIQRFLVQVSRYCAPHGSPTLRPAARPMPTGSEAAGRAPRRHHHAAGAGSAAGGRPPGTKTPWPGWLKPGWMTFWPLAGRGRGRGCGSRLARRRAGRSPGAAPATPSRLEAGRLAVPARARPSRPARRAPRSRAGRRARRGRPSFDPGCPPDARGVLAGPAFATHGAGRAGLRLGAGRGRRRRRARRPVAGVGRAGAGQVGHLRWKN